MRRVSSLQVSFFLIRFFFEYTNAYLQQVDDPHNDDDMQIGSPSPRSTASTTMTKDGEGEGRQLVRLFSFVLTILIFL